MLRLLERGGSLSIRESMTNEPKGYGAVDAKFRAKKRYVKGMVAA